MRSTVIMSTVTGTVMLAMHLLKMKEKVTNCQTLREKEFLPCALPPVKLKIQRRR